MGPSWLEGHEFHLDGDMGSEWMEAWVANGWRPGPMEVWVPVGWRGMSFI